jgi:anti-sigma-K factor RskA
VEIKSLDMMWDEVKHLGPLYALGALDQETTQAVEDFLQEATPEQMHEIREWSRVVALLPLALPASPVSEHLRETLLSRIAEEPRSVPSVPVVADEPQLLTDYEVASVGTDVGGYAEVDDAIAQAEVSTNLTEADVINYNYEDAGDTLMKSELDTPAEGMESLGNVYTFKSPQRSESRPLPWLLLAATVLLTFATSYLLWQNNRLTRQNRDLAVKLNEKEGEVEKIASPATKVIAMIGGKDVPQAGAKLVYDLDLQEWVVYVYNLPAPPSGKQYQLWYVTKKAKVNAAVFDTDQQGRTILRLRLPQEVIGGLAAMAVMLEPKGGSEQPTGDIFLQAGI